jgi:hypothetical protein
MPEGSAERWLLERHGVLRIALHEHKSTQQATDTFYCRAIIKPDDQPLLPV